LEVDADMTDILFTHAFFLRFDPKQWQAMQPYPPLGTLFAASYLREQGYGVALFDTILAGPPVEIVAELKKHRPKIVVFHEDNFNWLSKMCLVRMREACFEMIRLTKKTLGKDTPVIVAGSDATDHQDIYFECGADYAIVGESELTLHALVDSLSGKSRRPVKEIAGLAMPQNGSLVRTASRSYLKNLDALPFPAWDLVEVEKYRPAWQKRHGYYSVNMVTTRGCPFRCNWCAKPIYGNRYNSRSPENVVEELAWLKADLQPDHLWFADDIFGLKPGWVEKFGELVAQAGVATPFKIQGRVDLMHEEVVAGLKKAGCRTAWVGAESGSQKILGAMDKGTTVEQIYQATERLKRHGIEVCFFLQFGYPGETDDDIEKTMQMVRDCQPDDIGISVSYPLPGTKFYARVKNELGDKQNWQHSDDLAMMFAGKYQPDFYRQLHSVVHREFRLYKAAVLFSDIWKHPSQYTIDNLRKLVSAALRFPILQFERQKLERLKIQNKAISTELIPPLRGFQG
jgi:radical SAM superfamily enzyme YgiQ (UPF0313 family)